MVQEQIQYAPADKFSFAPQVRDSIDAQKLAELARSIDETGLLQTPRARKVGDQYVPAVGERRIRAMILNGEKSIPVIVEEKDLTAGEIFQRQLVENMQRVDLTPLEKARGIQKLMEETEWSATEAADNLGLSVATVSRLLAILDLPKTIQADIEAGKIAASAAYKLTQVRDARQQSELAGELAAGRMTRDGLNGAIKPKRRTPTRSSKRRAERVTASLSGGRSISISGPGLTVESLVACLEELLVRTREAASQATDLPSLAKLLKNSEVAR